MNDLTERNRTCVHGSFKTSGRVDVPRGFSQRLDGTPPELQDSPVLQVASGVPIIRYTCLRGCDGVSGQSVTGGVRKWVTDSIKHNILKELNILVATKTAKTLSPKFSTLKAFTSMPGLATVKIPDRKVKSEENTKDTQEKRNQIKTRPKSVFENNGDTVTGKWHFELLQTTSTRAAALSDRLQPFPKKGCQTRPFLDERWITEEDGAIPFPFDVFFGNC